MLVAGIVCAIFAYMAVASYFMERQARLSNSLYKISDLKIQLRAQVRGVIASSVNNSLTTKNVSKVIGDSDSRTFSSKASWTKDLREESGCLCRGILDQYSGICSRDQIKENTLKYCRYDNGVGTFEIISNISVNHVGAIVRINGPIIDTILFRPSKTAQPNVTLSRWVAKFTACKKGNYSGAVHIYLQDSGPEFVMQGKSCMDPLFTQPFMFTWTEATNTPACPHLWYWSDETNASDLSRYRNETRKDYAAAYSALRSTVEEFDFAAPRRAGKGAICLFGDSQMRNALNSIGRVAGIPSCNPEDAQKRKRNCNVPGFLYLPIAYPDTWSFDKLFPRCAHAFVNYGQWPAGWPTKPPWRFQHYRKSIDRFFARLLALHDRHPNVTITWVSTNPHPFNRRMAQCPAQEWRFPHVIAAYNAAARAAAGRTGGVIGYLDAFRVALPLLDLSFDDAHYQGPVGAAIGRVFGHCLDGDCPHIFRWGQSEGRGVKGGQYRVGGGT
jgi:hypothetical protein